MRRRIAASTFLASAVLAVTACSSGGQPASTAASTASPPSSQQASATPSGSQAAVHLATTPAAQSAQAAATRFFGLYKAGQYAMTWTLLSPSTRRQISRSTWIAVHEACPSRALGVAFRISNVAVTGHTAVVTYSLGGAEAALGSTTQGFIYSGGHWWFALSDFYVYRHGSVRADIAAAKAQGDCAN